MVDSAAFVLKLSNELSAASASEEGCAASPVGKEEEAASEVDSTAALASVPRASALATSFLRRSSLDGAREEGTCLEEDGSSCARDAPRRPVAAWRGEGDGPTPKAKCATNELEFALRCALRDTERISAAGAAALPSACTDIPLPAIQSQCPKPLQLFPNMNQTSTSDLLSGCLLAGQLRSLYAAEWQHPQQLRELPLVPIGLLGGDADGATGDVRRVLMLGRP